MASVLLSAQRARELADQHHTRLALRKAVARRIEDAARQGQMGARVALPESIGVRTEKPYDWPVQEAELVTVLQAASNRLAPYAQLVNELRMLGYRLTSRTHKRDDADTLEYAPVVSWFHLSWSDAQESSSAQCDASLPSARSVFERARQVQAVGVRLLTVLQRISEAAARGEHSVALAANDMVRENRQALAASLVGLGYRVDAALTLVSW
jgi:hypothetical protein